MEIEGKDIQPSLASVALILSVVRHATVFATGINLLVLTQMDQEFLDLYKPTGIDLAATGLR